MRFNDTVAVLGPEFRGGKAGERVPVPVLPRVVCSLFPGHPGAFG